RTSPPCSSATRPPSTDWRKKAPSSGEPRSPAPPPGSVAARGWCSWPPAWRSTSSGAWKRSREERSHPRRPPSPARRPSSAPSGRAGRLWCCESVQFVEQGIRLGEQVGVVLPHHLLRGVEELAQLPEGPALLDPLRDESMPPRVGRDLLADAGHALSRGFSV